MIVHESLQHRLVFASQVTTYSCTMYMQWKNDFYLILMRWFANDIFESFSHHKYTIRSSLIGNTETYGVMLQTDLKFESLQMELCTDKKEFGERPTFAVPSRMVTIAGIAGRPTRRCIQDSAISNWPQERNGNQRKKQLCLKSLCHSSLISQLLEMVEGG